MFTRTVDEQNEREFDGELNDHAHHRITKVRVTLDGKGKSGTFTAEAKIPIAWVIEKGVFISSKTERSFRVGHVRQSPVEGERHFQFNVHLKVVQ